MKIRFPRRKRAKALLTDVSADVPGLVEPADLPRLPKTTTVLVRPEVLAEVLRHSARYPRNEIAGLLLGRTEGKFLIVEDFVRGESIGSAVAVQLMPRDFDRALDAARKGQSTVGWFHSHPGHGVFMSATDTQHQRQGQGLFPDYVGLVMDPFRPGGVDFAFFRANGERFVQLPHHYYTGGAQ
jgi:26S proteasome regulatory subunit N11